MKTFYLTVSKETTLFFTGILKATYEQMTTLEAQLVLCGCIVTKIEQ